MGADPVDDRLTGGAAPVSVVVQMSGHHPPVVTTTADTPSWPVLLLRHRWAGPVLLLVAGAALVLPVERVVHAVAPTTQTRAVLADVGVERHGSGTRISYDHTAVAVTADGSALDLAAAGGGVGRTGLEVGMPVVVTRSAADGRVLQVRAPLVVVDIENHAGMVVLRVGSLLVAVAGLWLGLARAPRRWATAAVAVPVGALLALVAASPEHDIGAYPYPGPDAMRSYLDPPTRVPQDLTTFHVDEIVPVGTRVETSVGATVTVTGPLQPGLPAGADPEIDRWFDTVRLPLLAESDPDDPGTETLPTNLFLIGEGRGRTLLLDGDPACGGAAQALPSRFTTPREGYACYAVPDGFVPRYLVFRNDDVAVDLRPGPSG